jgi:eukaryotic-like serine/threonine-protein kinase
MNDAEFFERRVGTTLRNKWTLERLLGVGGMAAVYVGVHSIGRRDAIKILHPEIAASPELVERFRQEAHAVNRFRHPGAIEIRDIDTSEDGAPFLVMELLEGQPLSDVARGDQGIALDRVLSVTDQLLDVLAAAHEQGIVHRDIKPDNLFVQHDWRLKVLDFGIARMRQGSPKALATRTGTTLGTISYMPPEQVRGQADIDGRADLFAVGATMFRLLAKRRIHEASSELELMMKMAGDPAPPLLSVAPATPPDVGLVVDRALAFERDDRYQSAGEMQRDVRALMAGARPMRALELAASRPLGQGRPGGGLPGPSRASGDVTVAPGNHSTQQPVSSGYYPPTSQPAAGSPPAPPGSAFAGAPPQPSARDVATRADAAGPHGGWAASGEPASAASAFPQGTAVLAPAPTAGPASMGYGPPGGNAAPQWGTSATHGGVDAARAALADTHLASPAFSTPGAWHGAPTVSALPMPAPPAELARPGLPAIPEPLPSRAERKGGGAAVLLMVGAAGALLFVLIGVGLAMKFAGSDAPATAELPPNSVSAGGSAATAAAGTATGTGTGTGTAAGTPAGTHAATATATATPGSGAVPQPTQSKPTAANTGAATGNTPAPQPQTGGNSGAKPPKGGKSNGKGKQDAKKPGKGG